MGTPSKSKPVLIAAVLNLLAGPVAAQSWSLTGNTGTDPSTNFLGTSDDKELAIKTNNATAMSLLANGNINVGRSIDPLIDYARLTVTGADATPNVETAEILRLMRHGVAGVKNQNSAGFFVGSFEEGAQGRSQLDNRGRWLAH
jgi:hypothetical protein